MKQLTPDSREYVAQLHEEFPYQGCILDTENRSITIRQLWRILAFAERHCGRWRDLAPRPPSQASHSVLSCDTLNLHHLNEWMLKPATKERGCAFVELLTSADQPPMWFVSHWWGDRLLDFVACVTAHAKIRGTGKDTAYWVFACASRQHALTSAVTPNPEDASFYSAIQLSRGVLLILDEVKQDTGPATAFTRIWCAFEEALAFCFEEGTTRPGDRLLDIALIKQGKVEMIIDGFTEREGMLERHAKGSGIEEKVLREATFPVEVLLKGFSLQLELANASMDVDKRRILNCLSGNPLDGEYPREHPKYAEVNQRLRARFAIAAWPHAVAQGLVMNLNLPEVLAADAWRKHLQMDLCGRNRRFEEAPSSFGLTDAGMACLGKGLPQKLSTLHLRVNGYEDVGDAGVAALAAGLPPTLEDLMLSFDYCPRVGDAGMAALGQALPRDLKHISLDFRQCNVGDAGLAAVAACLPESTERLTLGLQCCDRITDAGAVALGEHLPRLVRLRAISIKFQGQKGITDLGVAAIAKGYPPSLQDMTSNIVTGTEVSTKMMVAFGSNLGMEALIEALRDSMPQPALAAQPAAPAEPLEWGSARGPDPECLAMESRSRRRSRMCALL